MEIRIQVIGGLLSLLEIDDGALVGGAGRGIDPSPMATRNWRKTKRRRTAPFHQPQ